MKLIKTLKSRDGKTIKYLQKTRDNYIIETGYFNLDEHIICISTQIGCPMNCLFCSAGKKLNMPGNTKPFIRNLTVKEIVKQVENIILSLQKQNKLKSKMILFSYLGVGEPFLNYKNVVQSVKVLTKKFPNSRVTISTVGVKPELIKKLAREKINTVLKLHLSLHSPNDILRRKLLPNAKKIKPVLNALKYFSKIKNVSAKVNYVLIDNVNDSPKLAEQLAKLLKHYSFTAKLSILNDHNFIGLKPSSEKRIKIFEKILNSHGIKTCRFYPNGTDIKASCGQLRIYLPQFGSGRVS